MADTPNATGGEQNAAPGAEQKPGTEQKPAPAGGEQKPAGQDAGAETPAWAKDIPEQFRGATAEETVAKMFPALKGYRDRDAQRGAVPKEAKDYEFQFDDKLKPYLGRDNDPMMDRYRKAAHELQMPGKDAQALLDKVFGPMAAEGKLPPLYDPQAEFNTISHLLGNKTDADGKAMTETAIAEADAWATNLGTQMKLSEKGQAELGSLLLTAGGFEILQALQKAMPSSGFRLGGQAANSGGLDKEQIMKNLSDPRANPMSRVYDPDFQKQAEADFEALRKTPPPSA